MCPLQLMLKRYRYPYSTQQSWCVAYGDAVGTLVSLPDPYPDSNVHAILQAQLERKVWSIAIP